MIDKAYIRTLRSYKNSVLNGDIQEEGIMEAFEENGFEVSAKALSRGILEPDSILGILDLCIHLVEAGA